MHHPTTEEEYNNLRNTDALVVVKFSAEWCGPCKKVAPEIEKMADEFTDVVFIHVDVDQLDECPDVGDVRGVPTFKFFKDKKLIESFSGANAPKVRQTIIKSTQ